MCAICVVSNNTKDTVVSVYNEGGRKLKLKALRKVRKCCHLNIISIQVKHVILIVKDLSRVLISGITSHVISQHKYNPLIRNS